MRCENAGLGNWAWKTGRLFRNGYEKGSRFELGARLNGEHQLQEWHGEKNERLRHLLYNVKTINVKCMSQRFTVAGSNIWKKILTNSVPYQQDQLRPRFKDWCYGFDLYCLGFIIYYENGMLRHSLGGEVIFFFCTTLLLLPWTKCTVCPPDLKLLLLALPRYKGSNFFIRLIGFFLWLLLLGDQP